MSGVAMVYKPYKRWGYKRNAAIMNQIVSKRSGVDGDERWSFPG